MRRELDEKLDAQLVAQQLRHGALGMRGVGAIFDFVLSRLSELEAPARADASRAWREQFDARMRAADDRALVKLLRPFFEFVFKKVEQIQRDTANAQAQQRDRRRRTGSLLRTSWDD